MTTLAQTSPENDITTHLVTAGGVTKRHISFNTGKQAYADIIGDTVRTVCGELQLDVNRGIPYFETVFKSVNGIDIWKNDVRKIVNGLSFVKSIVSFDVSWDTLNRKLNYEMVVETDEGKVTVGQSL